MNAKLFFGIRTVSPALQALGIILLLGLGAWSPVASGTNYTFNGYVYAVENDLGGATYSGATVNMLFHGGMNEATLEGFITDGFTETLLHCCGPFAEGSGIAIENDEVLDNESAALLNEVTGGSYSAGDTVDVAFMTASLQLGSGFEGRALVMQVVLVFPAATFADTSLSHFPVDSSQAIASLFYIEEINAIGETIFSLIGVVTELWTQPVIFDINPLLNDPWVNYLAPYQGFFISVFPGIEYLFLGWFTFDFIPPPGNTAFLGASDQRWVTGGGFYDGDSVTVDIELTTGGVFNGSTMLEAQQAGYGTARIGFIDCRRAVVNYQFPGPDLSGQMMLERVPVGNADMCESLNQQ